MTGRQRHNPVSGRLTRAILALTVTIFFPCLLTASQCERAGAAQDETKPTAKTDELSGVTSHLVDLAATLRVTQVDSKELEKIGRDFARTYAVKTLTFLYKQPDKMRLDGNSPVFGDAVLIQNGAVRYYAVPKLRLHNVEDLKSSPGKRMSLLEYSGLIAPEMLTFMQSHFVRHEAVDDQDTLVYDLTYKGVTGGSHFRIWVDPKNHITVKRDWFDGENHLKATFRYQEPREVAPGLWLPTRVEVKNGDGVVAAVTSMEDIQVGQGLSDSLFMIVR